MGRVKLSTGDQPERFVKTLAVPKAKKLPPVDHPVLDKKRITVRGLPRYIDSLMAAFAPHVLPDTLQALRLAVQGNEMRAVEAVLKAYGITQSGPGIVQNITQNNANVGAEGSSGHRSLDAFLRESATARATVIDAKPEVLALK